MTILRPINECQVEISLLSNDGEMSYVAAFLSSSGVDIFKRCGSSDEITPVVIKSVFDPIYYKDLLNYCINASSGERGDRFTLGIVIPRAGSGEILAQYQLTGCKLIGYSLPKFDRESGEAAQFSLTFQPAGVSKLLT